MTADEAAFKKQLEVLVQRYQHGSVADAEKDVRELVLTLHEQFPADIGIFCVYMLNYVKMKPGEAIFLSAGEPHAYILGDIVECMATSDNVIRVGLTHKLRDVPNLISGLTYQASEPSKHLVQPTPFAKATSVSTHSTLYDPPIPEFSVLRVVLQAGEDETHAPIDGPSIAIVTEGGGAVHWESSESLEVSEGDVLFVGADTQLRLASSKEKSLVVYRAFVEAV